MAERCADGFERVTNKELEDRATASFPRSGVRGMTEKDAVPIQRSGSSSATIRSGHPTGRLVWHARKLLRMVTLRWWVRTVLDAEVWKSFIGLGWLAGLMRRGSIVEIRLAGRTPVTWHNVDYLVFPPHCEQVGSK